MTMEGEMTSSRGAVESGEMRQKIAWVIPFGVVLAALVCLAVPGAALAQTMVVAGTSNAAPGGTAVVPISMTLPAGVPCATMQFKLTVIPSPGANPVEADVTFDSSVGSPTLNFNHGPDTVLVGWLSSFSPLLTGTLEVGALNVPIPASAQNGQTYTVRVFNPSGTTDGSTDLPMGGMNGAIAVGAEGGAAGGPAPAPGIVGGAPPVAEGGGVAPAPAAPSQPKAGAGAPPVRPALATAPTEVVPEVSKPGPAGTVPVPVATGAAAAETAGEQPPAGATAAPVGGGAPPAATPAATVPVAAPTRPAATNTAAKRPATPTPKAAAAAQAAATPAKAGGCQCQLDRQASPSGGLLLIPVAALLRLRRRHGGSGRSI